jgi:N-acetylglucosaminyl-diphospho-decaprenol L-rhamnosyltransferase
MITISIVSHGQKDLVHALLADLSAINSNLITHIVLTHNLTDDRSSFLDNVPTIKITQIFNVAPKGFGANHNAAFAVATGHYFAVLNPDIRIIEDPFPTLIHSLRQHSVELIAPKILNSDLTIADSARSLYTPWNSLKGLLKLGRLQVQPEWIAGMFMLFTYNSFRLISGFDEKYFMYVEDVDVCARLLLSGGALRYEPTVCVIHDARRENRKSLKHLSWHLRSALIWWTSDAFWRRLWLRD